MTLYSHSRRFYMLGSKSEYEQNNICMYTQTFLLNKALH